MSKPKGTQHSYDLSVKRMKKDGAIMREPEALELNRAMIQHAMEIQQLSTTCDRNDIESVRSTFMNYMALCQKNGMKPGNIGLCTALGVNISTLDGWTKNDKKPEFREFAIAVKGMIATVREGMIADGLINPVIGIFWQRNYDGLRNDTEQIQNPNEDDSDQGFSSPSEVIKKYGNLLQE